jgi:hypothetical protein
MPGPFHDILIGPHPLNTPKDSGDPTQPRRNHAIVPLYSAKHLDRPCPQNAVSPIGAQVILLATSTHSCRGKRCAMPLPGGRAFPLHPALSGVPGSEREVLPHHTRCIRRSCFLASLDGTAPVHSSNGQLLSNSMRSRDRASKGKLFSRCLDVFEKIATAWALVDCP